MTQLLFSPLLPLSLPLAKVGNQSLSDFPHCWPATCSRLLVVPTASQGRKGRTVLTKNKELAIVSSCEPDSRPKKSYCVWTVRMHKGLQVGSFHCNWRISEDIQYSANILSDPSRTDMKGAKRLAKVCLCHSTFNWSGEVIWKQPESWKTIRISKRKTNFACEYLQAWDHGKGRQFEVLVSRIQEWLEREGDVGRGWGVGIQQMHEAYEQKMVTDCCEQIMVTLPAPEGQNWAATHYNYSFLGSFFPLDTWPLMNVLYSKGRQ